jgi:hypothetical protein
MTALPTDRCDPARGVHVRGLEWRCQCGQERYREPVLTPALCRHGVAYSQSCVVCGRVVSRWRRVDGRLVVV